MTEGTDSHGNFHDTNGRFVSLRDFVMQIFDEREKQTEFTRVQVDRALTEAKATTDKQILDAKSAADSVAEAIVKRLVNLESGGAPFASRLDQSLTQLKLDVDVLKENMVKTTVLDALREQTVQETKAQKRQIKYIAIAAAVSFGFSLILVGVQVFQT